MEKPNAGLAVMEPLIAELQKDTSAARYQDKSTRLGKLRDEPQAQRG